MFLSFPVHQYIFHLPNLAFSEETSIKDHIIFAYLFHKNVAFCAIVYNKFPFSPGQNSAYTFFYTTYTAYAIAYDIF